MGALSHRACDVERQRNVDKHLIDRRNGTELRSHLKIILNREEGKRKVSRESDKPLGKQFSDRERDKSSKIMKNHSLHSKTSSCEISNIWLSRRQPAN
jgi:hypothetical protein